VDPLQIILSRYIQRYRSNTNFRELTFFPDFSLQKYIPDDCPAPELT